MSNDYVASDASQFCLSSNLFVGALSLQLRRCATQTAENVGPHGFLIGYCSIFFRGRCGRIGRAGVTPQDGLQ